MACAASAGHGIDVGKGYRQQSTSYRRGHVASAKHDRSERYMKICQNQDQPPECVL
jgi:hypothetical protein